MLAQTSGPLDYRLYTTKAHPYMIPSLPSGSTFFLIIKTGHPIYVATTSMDKGSGNYYLDGNGTPRNISSDTILIEVGDAGTGLINFKVNNVAKTLGLWVNYQADLQDQTIGSSTYGDYPDFIWVPQGGSAKVSAGPNMNPTGSTNGGYFWFKETWNQAGLISSNKTDSIKNFTLGNYISRTADGSGNSSGATNDTISILEKPTFNPTAKTLNFPTTVSGIAYKLLKVSTVSGNDTTWSEAHNVAGDGNARTLNLTDGTYKLTVTRGIYTATYPYGYFRPGITTAVNTSQVATINYRLVGNNLQFDREVHLKFYSLQGQILQQAQGSAFTLAHQTGIFTAIDKNGNTVRAKIITK
jgi:hypothetical protein